MALHHYQDKHGQLPPAVVYGEDGTPLHSWRVLLLPFLEEGDLYQQYRLGEPWDSPHNLALLPKMPYHYAPPPGKVSRLPPHHTVCQGFVGPGAAFDGRDGLNLRTDFPDGTSNTFLVVEGGEPVPWTKPADVPFHPDRPLPPLSTLFHDGFRAAFADGSVRFIPGTADEATLRATVSRNGKDRPWTDR